MSLTYSDMDAAVRTRFLPKAIEQIFTSNAVMVKMAAKSKVEFDGGKTIAQPVIYGKLPSGSFSGMDTFNISQVQTQTLGEWNWKSHYVDVTLAGDDLDKAEGDEKIIGLLASKMETAVLTANDDFATFFFGDGTGNGGKDWDGFLDAVDNGTLYATYGGIERTANTWWKGQMDTTGGATTIDAINSMLGTCTIGQRKPDLAFTTQTIYDKIWARIQPQQRFLDSKSALAQVGFTGINFNGHCEIIVDNHCPSGSIFFISTEWWKMILHKKRNFFWTEQKTPVDADGYVRQMITRGNLICIQPRVNGQMTSLT